MTQEELLAHLRREPFQPFRLVMADGTHLDVPRSGLVIPGVHVSLVGIPHARRSELIDHTVRIEYARIVGVEPLGEPTPTPIVRGERAVTAEQLRGYLRRVPFQPLALHLDNGERFEVTARERMMVTPRTTAVAVPAASGEVIVSFANSRIVRIEEIGDGRTK